MTTINLRDFYPWYAHDEYVEVSEPIAAEMIAGKRNQRSDERRRRRYKVYSLDADDGTEGEAVIGMLHSAEAVFETTERQCHLGRAFSSLSKIQQRRIEAHYVFGISQKKIAEVEGVTKGSVSISIHRGLEAIKKKLNNFS